MMTPSEIRAERASRTRWKHALTVTHGEQPRPARSPLDPPPYREPLPRIEAPANWIASLPDTSTVSSRTIAGLTGKRHTLVLRDIRKMSAFLAEDLGTQEAMAGMTEVRDNRGFAVECRLSRAVAMALMGGYSPVARYRLGQRVQELEAGAGKVVDAAPAQPVASKNPPERPDSGECRMNALTIADTAIRTDIAGRYCLNDLHRASGGEQRHQPRYWLANAQTQALVAELEASANLQTPTESTDSGIPLSVQKGGVEQGTYVARELVYAYGMWISPAFHLRVIRAYDAMVRQGVGVSPEAAKGHEELQARVAALEAKMAEHAAIGREYAPISAMRHKYGYPFSWEELKEASIQHGLRIRKMSNGKCGYHRRAWLEAYGIEL